MDNQWERVKEPDDPRRCQASTGNGQCLNVAMVNSKNCAAHGGNFDQIRARKAETRIYNLNKYRQRLTDHADNDNIKSLREEIGILRILIEEKINRCKDDFDLALQAGPISDLVMKTEKLVTSCNKSEMHLGSMLDKTQALQLGSEIVDIVAKALDGVDNKEDILEGIANDICNAVDRLSTPSGG